MRILKRMVPIIEGIVNYGNPGRIALSRVLPGNGIMNIRDRETGVSVLATVPSYQMFGETWYSRDYDVPACPVKAGHVVIDVGANQGFFSCYAASKGAKVQAFEPFPDNCNRLRKNVHSNGFSSLVEISQKAVTAETGRAKLLCSSFLGGGANTIMESHARALGKDFSNIIEVETISIDCVLNKIDGRVRLCKIDCEGAEWEILARISDPTKVNSFAIEFHPGAYNLRKLVQGLMNWGTHQIGFATKAYILYAVHNEVLADYADALH